MKQEYVRNKRNVLEIFGSHQQKHVFTFTAVAFTYHHIIKVCFKSLKAKPSWDYNILKTTKSSALLCC